MQDVSSLFVTLLGMGTTFFGLICIILLSMLMSFFCKIAEKKKPNEPVAETAASSNNTAIPNRGQVVAAISAAIAEDMGKDVSALRIHSIKKI